MRTHRLVQRLLLPTILAALPLASVPLAEPAQAGPNTCRQQWHKSTSVVNLNCVASGNTVVVEIEGVDAELSEAQVVSVGDIVVKNCAVASCNKGAILAAVQLLFPGKTVKVH